MPSLYEISVPVYIKSLKTLSKLLEKGSAHAAVSNEQLINSRLIADMENFTFQIQRVSDFAKFVAERLGKVAPAELKDNEKTIEELQERIKRTIEILEKVKESDFAGEEDEINFKIKEHEFKFTAKAYILDWTSPNFYFHFVTAYDLLRKEGGQHRKEGLFEFRMISSGRRKPVMVVFRLFVIIQTYNLTRGGTNEYPLSTSLS